jgi:hypothetical protein
MTLSALALCSRALLKIGAQPVASLEEGTAEAEVAANLYPGLRDALLAGFPWHFATTQATLPRLAAAPAARSSSLATSSSGCSTATPSSSATAATSSRSPVGTSSRMSPAAGSTPDRTAASALGSATRSAPARRVRTCRWWCCSATARRASR